MLRIRVADWLSSGGWRGVCCAAVAALAMVGMVSCTTESEYVAPRVSNPASVTVTAGQTASFNVTATGAAPLRYQWFENGAAISGATMNAFTTPPAASWDSGELFTVSVSNQYGAVVSLPATLTVVTPVADYPVILTQPVGGVVCNNSTLTLSVTASNATGYQWKLNGVAIAGATGSTYTVVHAQAAQSGVYTVVVSNALATVTSNAVTVSIGSTITTNPANVAISAGQVGTFTVAATGEGPFTYQWYEIAPGSATGSAIAGATAGTYVTPVAGAGDDGTQFYATVTDACGTVYTSSVAIMTVTFGDVPPTIVQQPMGQSVAAGASVTFTALAVGTPTITYQWYRIAAGAATGTAISGATGTSYTVPAGLTAASDNGDQYYVIATNAYGQAASQDATLAIGNGILIITQPVSQYVLAGQTATFSVTATSSSPLTYQWYEAAPGSASFAAVAGATGASYSVTNTTVSESGSVFRVVVSNGTSSVTSSTAALYVGALNQIGGLCNSQWLPHGSAVEIVAPDGSCSYRMTDAGTQAGQLVWQELIGTGNLQLSFTITMSNPSTPPADGFTVTLGDPSQGATLTSVGATGKGLGASGIPGFVLAFDTYQNGSPDAPIVPYVGVTRGNTGLFEDPWFNYNDNIAPIVAVGQVITTNYTITLVNGQMTVTQNGSLIFSGAVSAVPPTAYLMVTASTGGQQETLVISNLSAVVSAP
jgi:hypothetical protein